MMRDQKETSMKTQFACMAEAVAHFYAAGYSTIETSGVSNGRRVMAKAAPDQLLCPMIELIHADFLLVTAKEI